MRKLNKYIDYSIDENIIEVYPYPQATIQDATDFMEALELFYNIEDYNIIWAK